MSEIFTNETGCTVSVSHITGDIVCQKSGPECDCLVLACQCYGCGSTFVHSRTPEGNWACGDYGECLEEGEPCQS